MAVKKSEAIATLTQKQEAQVEAHEQYIDEAIRQEYCGENGISVGVEGYIDNKVLNELKKRYTAAGWTLTYECDQREGRFFRLV